VLNNVADELRCVHPLGELFLNIVSALDSDARKIGTHWRENLGRD
jgi:hypothetical protein